MKLRDVVERIDRSDKNRSYIDSSVLFNELNVSNDDYGLCLEDHGFNEFYFATWLCTDTWVGGTVIFYHDDAVATTWQTARKNTKSFSWIGGMGTYERMARVCRELNAPSRTSTVSECNLDEEVGDGLKIAYSGQLLDTEVIFDATGDLVTVVKTFNGYNEIKKWHDVVVRDRSGVDRTVKMDEVTVPFRIGDPPRVQP